ncbi:MAG TPA: hypothetical protein VI837_05525 [Blastocatellia bacterium]|nr:hypothetical protein [Blastocatellia bacterium]
MRSDSGRADSFIYAHSSDRPLDKRFVCGYDPQGATDELSNHKLNVLGLTKRGGGADFAPRPTAAGILVEDAEDVAQVEDYGTIVISPTRFNLKNSSIRFTPDGDGYRISSGGVAFTRDFGYRLGYFFGADDKLGDGDNGYRNVTLLGAQFPFFGVFHDTIFIGTNGYITFTKGDATARISPTTLGSDLPRIAPLWADLEVVDSGNIYYNRLDGRHLITWEGAGQPSYGGISTFQAVLYDDGRIAFAYRKVKAQAALVGISPGGSAAGPQPVDFSSPPAERVSGPFFQTFGKQRRIDLPALLQAFYRTHSDRFDTAYVWTDFDYDNGLGVAHSFNVRNHISGIGLKTFDRGLAYGSPARLSTIITMGNAADWPSDPQAHAAGLNSAISIVCHEQGHRWLAYVRFDADHDIKDDLLGRENAHWSFLVDTRTNSQGSFSSLMEGNAWRDGGGGTFTTIESAVDYFTPLDQYLMGLRSADEVGEIPYLVTDAQLTEFLREKSPFSGFSMSAVRKTTSVAQIVEREGPRIPDSANAPKELRVAFILLTEQGSTPSSATLEKISRYRDSLVRYFSIATGGRGSMDASLKE